MEFRLRDRLLKRNDPRKYNRANPQEEVMHGPYVPNSSGRIGMFAMMGVTGGETEVLMYEQVSFHQDAVKEAREAGRISPEDADKLLSELVNTNVDIAYGYTEPEITVH
jgi:hypothetical protein